MSGEYFSGDLFCHQTKYEEDNCSDRESDCENVPPKSNRKHAIRKSKMEILDRKGITVEK